MSDYTEVAPSGVTVHSTIPFVEPRWWDRPALHWIWSWASWITNILRGYGHPGPRRWFEAHLQREENPGNRGYNNP